MWPCYAQVLSPPSLPTQVCCLPWAWGAHPNASLVVSSPDVHALVPLPGESAPHALLCGLLGTLPLTAFLRVSSLPKITLLAVLTACYILVLELSKYSEALG